MIAVETRERVEELRVEWQRLGALSDTAATFLAYDLTFRADDDYNGQHNRPSAALTAKLKAEFRAAHTSAMRAFDDYLIASGTKEVRS